MGVESRDALVVGECYFSYLRRIYGRTCTDSLHIKPELELSIVVKICNDTAGVDGLSPTLLVFWDDSETSHEL